MRRTDSGTLYEGNDHGERVVREVRQEYDAQRV
jgi:hypothetical protein